MKRRVRQGDVVSKFFLEHSFKTLEWETKGVMIDEERLNNLRFADHIVLIPDNYKKSDKL